MTDPTDVPLDTVSAAVAPFGWQFQADVLTTTVPVGSFAEACRVAEVASGAGTDGTDGLLRADVRAGAAHLTVATRAPMTVTRLELDLVGAITRALATAGHSCGATTTDAGPDGPARPVPAVLELAVDALDVAAVRPFWKVLLGYVDKSDGTDPGHALVDPAGRLPALWFQQMDAPRPQRNRLHLDVWVARDEVRSRLAAVLAAGGVLVNDTYAPAFWTVADVEGNEACLCAWSTPDDRSGG